MWQELRVCGQRRRRPRKEFGPAIAHGEDIALCDSSRRRQYVRLLRVGAELLRTDAGFVHGDNRREQFADSAEQRDRWRGDLPQQRQFREHQADGEGVLV